ncbi:recombinase family protein [Brevibacterium sp.]|uniref:recombinase family protein n=1 Tax=Brevibacterium sp. TaxID=1701 RepID=UPI0035C80774
MTLNPDDESTPTSVPDTTLQPVNNPRSEAQNGLDSSGHSSVNGHMDTSATSPLTAPPPVAIADPLAAFTQSFTLKRAVSYLRVSTREQAHRGGREEGFSIPAQREANKQKAGALGAKVVKEFVEPGASGTSLNRPGLKEMLRYLEQEHARIDYIIVHKLDRLARNRFDDADLGRKFAEWNIRLISTSENIDQTPGGILLHGIMSSIAEFYSNNLSNEVKKGMTEKVRSGGTHGRAPIGYLNTREIINGRENRTVVVDEKRAPLVRWAFEEYATGNWSVRRLTNSLVSRGLTTVPSPQKSAEPIGRRSVELMLKNPYYTGMVRFKGALYPGSHEALVDRKLFETVQAVLAGKANGERTRTHEHHLKSTLYCGHCDSRMMITNAKSSRGEIYPYYVCLGRHSKRTPCTLKSVLIDAVEEQMSGLYKRLALGHQLRGQMERLLREGLRLLRKDDREARDQLCATRDEIERKQRKLLEAHYNDAISIDMLREEQKSLGAQLIAVQRDLERFEADDADSERVLSQALDFAEYCFSMYTQAPDHIKRMFNQVFFEKVLVIQDGHEHRVEPVFNAPFDVIFDPLSASLATKASSSTNASSASSEQSVKQPVEADGLYLDVLDQAALTQVECLSKSAVVGPEGLEPPTLSV